LEEGFVDEDDRHQLIPSIFEQIAREENGSQDILRQG
jgi:hypothetical protein